MVSANTHSSAQDGQTRAPNYTCLECTVVLLCGYAEQHVAELRQLVQGLGGKVQLKPACAATAHLVVADSVLSPQYRVRCNGLVCSSVQQQPSGGHLCQAFLYAGNAGGQESVHPDTCRALKLAASLCASRSTGETTAHCQHHQHPATSSRGRSSRSSSRIAWWSATAVPTIAGAMVPNH
jgi:hypothetical protein